MIEPAHDVVVQPGSLIRVFVVDDHELVRRGLCDLLLDAPDVAVVGESGSAADAVRRIPALKPDVVVMDVRLPDGSGVDVCAQIRAQVPSIRVLMLTSYDDRNALVASARAGAAGFVLKQVQGDALIEVLRGVAAGRPAAHVPTPHGAAPTTSPSHQLLDSLSGQEARVLDGIIEGLTNREIGQRLGIAEQTVKNHVSNVLAKLGARYRTQAAVIGAEARRPVPRPGSHGHRSG